MAKKKKVEVIKEEKVVVPVDCRNCRHYAAWKYGLIDCDKTKVPVENCIYRHIKCVNYENKDNTNICDN